MRKIAFAVLMMVIWCFIGYKNATMGTGWNSLCAGVFMGLSLVRLLDAFAEYEAGKNLEKRP